MLGGGWQCLRLSMGPGMGHSECIVELALQLGCAPCLKALPCPCACPLSPAVLGAGEAARRGRHLAQQAERAAVCERALHAQCGGQGACSWWSSCCTGRERGAEYAPPGLPRCWLAVCFVGRSASCMPALPPGRRPSWASPRRRPTCCWVPRRRSSSAPPWTSTPARASSPSWSLRQRRRRTWGWMRRW